MAYKSGTYLGKQTMGQGNPIPVQTDGTIDINALVGMLVDQRKDYVYDTKTLPPGYTFTGTPLRFFQVAIGQQDPDNGNIVKTEQETNMRTGGSFSPPYDFIMNNLGFYLCIGADVYDIATIFNMTRFEFKILQKIQFAGHLQRHPSGMGVTGMSTQGSQQNWLNGIADPRAIWWFGDWRKYIPPQVNFTLDWYGNESYQNLYNAATVTSTNLPASILAKQFTTGLITAVSSLPTLLTQAAGGQGIKLIALMNGVSNGPVQ